MYTSDSDKGSICRILIKNESFMRLIVLTVCCKFHEDRPKNEKSYDSFMTQMTHVSGKCSISRGEPSGRLRGGRGHAPVFNALNEYRVLKQNPQWFLNNSQ